MAEGCVRHYTEWTPRLLNRSRYEYEDESKETSTIMNLLGYGPVIRRRRREVYKEEDRLWSAYVYGHGQFITVGSKAEGLTCVVESDRDCLSVLSNTVCLEHGVDESILPGYISVFKMHMQSCNAGYCRLLLVRLGPSVHDTITDSICDDGYGRILISSTCFVEKLKQKLHGGVSQSVNHARAGPSVPGSNGPFKFDYVLAIRCDCPVILQKWASRARHWPPPDIVEKVIAMGAFVAAIGFKGSEHNHVEWRICFNTAETELVNNLNDTQVKLYVILKMIVNDVLKPQSKEVTSYTLKNIVLWLAENNPQTLFYSGSLFHWLHEGLDILRTAISICQLPYYMIPERNLMAERGLDVEQQGVWVRSITDMINDGPRVLLRLKKIRQAVVCHPEPILWFSKMRTELEMIYLEFQNIRVQFADTNGQVDLNYTRVQVDRYQEILMEVMLRMQREGSSVNDVEKISEMMLS